MAPRYKIDAFKRTVMDFKRSTVFSQPERFTYYLGLRTACRILAGESAGVTRLMDAVIEQESQAAKGE